MPAVTPSQTIGPFLHIEVPYEGEDRLVEPNHPGAIRLLGAVTDGEGNVVDDALVEIWQANAAGRYAALPIPRAASSSSPSSPAPCPAPAIAGRRRTSTSRCLRADCSTAS